MTKRITLVVSEDLYKRLHDAVPWGFRRHLLNSVIDTVVRAIDTDGEIVMGAVMAGQFKLVWEKPDEATQQ